MLSTDVAAIFEELSIRLADAANETEVRDRFCGQLHENLGIEFNLERGKTDAKYNGVVLEFKDLGSFMADWIQPNFGKHVQSL